VLEALMNYVPQDTSEATILAERIAPRLSHQNSAVVLNCVRVLLYLFNYMSDQNIIKTLCQRLSPPLVTLLSKGPEIQYLALRNVLLILQRYPEVLRSEIRVFFCKYNDPIYVKVTKLELLFTLASASNIDEVLAELREYATEIDVHFVRKAVRAIGKLAIKIEPAARACIDTLLELMATKVSYIVQEATVVIRNIFRKYPNRYESVIGTLCEHLDSLDEPEAKAAMIWIIGQYADRISNSADLLEDFLFSFKEETYEVQLALLTATVKLFIARPTKGASLVPKVLKWATEESDHPDLRERGFFYWRLLSYSNDTSLAKQVVMGEKPAITTEAEKLDPHTLQEMCLNVGTLATIYLKPVKTVFRNARDRRLEESPALQKHMLPVAIAERERRQLGGAAKNPFASAMTQQSQRDVSSPSLMGSQVEYGNGNGDLAAAVDAADEYFAGLNGLNTNMAGMSVGDDDLLTPQGAPGGRNGFMANQNYQYGSMTDRHERDGEAEEDLLSL
jgi:AP-2 complex subunit beta-1